jgi:hypothetical protein
MYIRIPNRFTLTRSQKGLKLILILFSFYFIRECWAADTYNPVSNQLAIPSVDVSGILYNNVLITVGNVVSIGGGSPSSTHDSYNPKLNQLHIPSVQVGSETYTNVVITVGKVLSVGGASEKDTQPAQASIIWRQTNNSITLTNDWQNSLSGEGYASFDFDGKGIKSFFFPPGANSWSYPRLVTDPDFQLFQIGAGNQIVQVTSPLATPYIAGHVNDDVLTGKFFSEVSQSLIFIDHGREPQDRPYDQWEKSFLWRMDKNNGRWNSVEFAQDLGRQFWHSSSNPLDVNGDGLLDFSVAALSTAVNYLFVSKGNDFDKIRLADFIASSDSPNCGSSALIRLAGNRFGSICLPYTSSNYSQADIGYIFKLSASGKSVDSVQKIKVRNIPETQGMDPGEGYNLIRVLDLNGDGLDDFIAHAEFANGNNNKKTRMIAFLQGQDGQFTIAPSKIGIGPTYSLNYGNADFYNDWVEAKSVLTDINGDGKTDLAIPLQLILHQTIEKNGIQAGLIQVEGAFRAYSIPPSQIIFNALQKPYNYRNIYPVELNGDGIIDFVLVGTFYDQPKTANNIYGQRFEMTMLISERR